MARIKSNTDKDIISLYRHLSSRINTLQEKSNEKTINLFEEIQLHNLNIELELVKTEMLLLQLEIPDASD